MEVNEEDDQQLEFGHVGSHSVFVVEAMTDMLSIAKSLRRAPKRRSCPPWAVPAELRGIAIDPELSLKPDRLGVGAERGLDSSFLYGALQNGLQCV